MAKYVRVMGLDTLNRVGLRRWEWNIGFARDSRAKRLVTVVTAEQSSLTWCGGCGECGSRTRKADSASSATSFGGRPGCEKIIATALATGDQRTDAEYLCKGGIAGGGEGRGYTVHQQLRLCRVGCHQTQTQIAVENSHVRPLWSSIFVGRLLGV
jgi:hypothetical protein